MLCRTSFESYLLSRSGVLREGSPQREMGMKRSHTSPSLPADSSQPSVTTVYGHFLPSSCQPAADAVATNVRLSNSPSSSGRMLTARPGWSLPDRIARSIRHSLCSISENFKPLQALFAFSAGSTVKAPRGDRRFERHTWTQTRLTKKPLSASGANRRGDTSCSKKDVRPALPSLAAAATASGGLPDERVLRAGNGDSAGRRKSGLIL